MFSVQATERTTGAAMRQLKLTSTNGNLVLRRSGGRLKRKIEEGDGGANAVWCSICIAVVCDARRSSALCTDNLTAGQDASAKRVALPSGTASATSTSQTRAFDVATKLPADTLGVILSFLPPRTMARMSRVCKQVLSRLQPGYALR